MRRVLFVGEEQPLWQDIRQQRNGFGSEWQANFAKTGPEALARLEKEDFAAVVADVQLLDMSGVDLLDAVLQRQCNAIRILLSESSDLQSTVKCIGKAHHHLLKPCDAAMVLTALEEGLNPSGWRPSKSVQDLIGKMRWVPSPPNIYFRIAMEMDSPSASVETVGRIIAEDPPTTAKVLQMANSAVFGLHMQVNEPADAVAYIGMEAARTLVLLAHTFSEFDRLPRSGFSIDELWYHSVLVGQIARRIALVEQAGSEVAEQAYAAGLLHDLGKVMFAANLPVPFGQALILANQGEHKLHLAETQLFGANHAEIGACLLEIWGLPAPIVEAVAFHHQPEAAGNKNFSALTAVHAADVFAQQITPEHAEPLPLDLDMAYLRRLGLVERSECWRRSFQELDIKAV
jgi:HD-like signal output (HDOD) protein/CheY-like chemotaxis protein